MTDRSAQRNQKLTATLTMQAVANTPAPYPPIGSGPRASHLETVARLLHASCQTGCSVPSSPASLMSIKANAATGGYFSHRLAEWPVAPVIEVGRESRLSPDRGSHLVLFGTRRCAVHVRSKSERPSREAGAEARSTAGRYDALVSRPRRPESQTIATVLVHSGSDVQMAAAIRCIGWHQR